MKRKSFLILFLIGLILMISLSSCTTVPAKLLTEPLDFEDNNIRVTYAIGSKIYYIKIYNKTANRIFIDFNRSFIISHDGETRTLKLSAMDSHIPPESYLVPPESYLVLASYQDTFFASSIERIFEIPSESPQQVNEKEFLEQFIGKRIRLYLTTKIEEETAIYDIKLKVIGVEHHLPAFLQTP